MKVLLAGGSGRVATLVIPFLKKQHQLRVYDRNPPADQSLVFLQGELTDPVGLEKAVEGRKRLLHFVGNFFWRGPGFMAGLKVRSRLRMVRGRQANRAVEGKSLKPTRGRHLPVAIAG